MLNRGVARLKLCVRKISLIVNLCRPDSISRNIKKYILIFYHQFSSRRKKHSYWWPSDTRSQDIGNHGIEQFPQQHQKGYIFWLSMCFNVHTSVFLCKDSYASTGTKLWSFWRNFNHWLHWKLSKLTTANAVSDKNFIKMKTNPFQFLIEQNISSPETSSNLPVVWLLLIRDGDYP